MLFRDANRKSGTLFSLVKLLGEKMAYGVHVVPIDRKACVNYTFSDQPADMLCVSRIYHKVMV